MGDKASERKLHSVPDDDRQVCEVILAAAPDGVLAVDSGNVVRYCNRAAEELLGQPPGGLTGGQLDPDLLPECGGELELNLAGDTGRVLDLRLSSAALNGESVRIALIRDITQRKDFERSLEAALSRQNAALAVAGHELRGPLAAIGVLAHVLADDQVTLGSDDRRSVANRVADHAGRLQRLISRLLTSARIDAQAISPARRRVRVASVIDEQLRAADRKGAEDVIVSCPTDLAVVADRDELAMMLGNYLDNALIYAKPPIAVVAAPRGGAVQIEVTDAGPGVPDSFAPQLFERFTRAPGAGLRSEGMGLGLWIVRTFAQANDGDAWYEPGLAGGSRFCLRLPLAASRSS